MSLVPKIVVAESNDLYHEIGAASIAGGPGAPYYVRWVNVDNNWYIAVDVTAIGGGEVRRKDKTSSMERTSPMETIAALDKEFQQLYNSQDFAGVASLYNPGADLIPPTCDTLINNQTSITTFFEESFAHGLKTVHRLAPTKVFVEKSDLWHEIGLCTSCVGDLLNPYSYCCVRDTSAWSAVVGASIT